MEFKNNGPELSPEVLCWIKKGGPFPSEITVSFPGNEAIACLKRTYKILEIDELGFLHTIARGRYGKKGFVLKVKDDAANLTYAAKICDPRDYDDGRYPLTELQIAEQLREYKSLHLPEAIGRVSRFESEPQGDDNRQWICILSPWLEGENLDDILTNDPNILDPELIVSIATELIKATLFLEKKGVKHDDLHLRNIMLVPADAALREIDPEEPDHQLKLVDWGSAKPSDKATLKNHDDWSCVAVCLARLHNIFSKNRAYASRYWVFLRDLKEFIEDLSEEDQARHFPNAPCYLQRIRELRTSLTVFKQQESSFRPFDAISAEHLANDKLLLNLFVCHLPWIEMIRGREPTILVGPRGCGKSMVLRYLSIRTHVNNCETGPEILDEIGFLGVYIGCASDLGNDLIWINRQKDRAKKLASEILTYGGLVLAREFLRSLAVCAKAKSIAQKLGLTGYVQHSLVTHVTEQLGSGAEITRLKDTEVLQACVDRLDRLRLELGLDLLNARPASVLLPATFIRDLCRLAVRLMPSLEHYSIVFLLDDYTCHRLSAPIQEILNTILWQRDSSHLFKISSEPYGFTNDHLDGTRIDANREFIQIDAGQLTIGHDQDPKRREFITSLLNKRLKEARYMGTVEGLVGNSTHRTDPELARAIRAFGGKNKNRTGNRNHYHGIHILANAWSGDIATILHMVRDMFARGNVTASTTNVIPHNVQHDAITSVSTAMRSRIAGYHPYGEKMSEIVMAMGDLARKLLIDSPDKTNRKGGESIHRKYRIEISLPANTPLSYVLSTLPGGEELVMVLQELVRRALFIELPESRGKEDAIRRTYRIEMRASLLPSFGTSLIRESYLDIKRVEDFAELLSKPSKAAESLYLRYAKQPEMDLFSDLVEDMGEQ